jgi:hypothetical protein
MPRVYLSLLRPPSPRGSTESSFFAFISPEHGHFRQLSASLQTCIVSLSVPPQTQIRYISPQSLLACSSTADPPLGAVFWCVILLACAWHSSSHGPITIIVVAVISTTTGAPKQQSTGSVGVSNMRPPSFDRAVSGPDDYSDTRGRDPIPPGDPYVVNTLFFFATASQRPHIDACNIDVRSFLPDVAGGETFAHPRATPHVETTQASARLPCDPTSVAAVTIANSSLASTLLATLAW